VLFRSNASVSSELKFTSTGAERRIRRNGSISRGGVNCVDRKISCSSRMVVDDGVGLVDAGAQGALDVHAVGAGAQGALGTHAVSTRDAIPNR
jgi:hypothetical protein